MADIKSTFVSLSNNLAKSSGDFFKNTKLNMELANEEEKRKSIYIEIGKKVHEIYMFGGSLGAAFDDLHKDLVLSEGRIKDLQERIDVVKGVRTCTSCGKGVDRKNEFCPHCGERMFPASEIKQEAESIAVDAPDSLPAIASEDFSDALAGAAAQDIEAPQPFVEEKPLPDVKKCPSCGAENSAGSRFCLSCGRVI